MKHISVASISHSSSPHTSVSHLGRKQAATCSVQSCKFAFFKKECEEKCLTTICRRATPASLEFRNNQSSCEYSNVSLLFDLEIKHCAIKWEDRLAYTIPSSNFCNFCMRSLSRSAHVVSESQIKHFSQKYTVICLKKNKEEK